jgi:glycosyltransferase involved in cell wall biosynthesis
MGRQIEALGVPVYSMDLRGRGLTMRTLRDTARLVQNWHPSVVQGWMYHGNLAASLVGVLLGGRPRVLWNVRQCLYDIQREKPLTRAAIWAGRLLSGMPEHIVYNSRLSARQHEQFGFASKGRRLLENGFDVARFAPSASARSSVRDELGLPAGTFLFGMVARYHPMKDHALLLRAVAQLDEPDVHVLLAGRGVEETNDALTQQLETHGISENVHLLGERSDIPRLMASLDAYVSSSNSESFSNVIGEAMACGVFCIVTDVGASAKVVGDTGICVSPRDLQSLSRGLRKATHATEEERVRRGKKARERIVREYSLKGAIEKYEQLYLREPHGRRMQE